VRAPIDLGVFAMRSKPRSPTSFCSALKSKSGSLHGQRASSSRGGPCTRQSSSFRSAISFAKHWISIRCRVTCRFRNKVRLDLELAKAAREKVAVKKAGKAVEEEAAVRKAAAEWA